MGSLTRFLFNGPAWARCLRFFGNDSTGNLPSLFLDARRAGSLDPQQAALADRCEILIQGLATVGIIALVDEATGYQEIRAKRALATILEKFIADELQPWTKTFPFEFYVLIARLKGWPSSYAIKRPSVVGHYTNDLIYSRLAPGLLKELKSKDASVPERNPP